MKFTDNMSVPLWKIGLLQKKQRKKEEEKRKEREAEEERLRKLPPWKRQAEQPKTVIIIDKNKTPNPVDLVELSKQASSSSKSSAKQTPLVNGTAQKVDSGESQGNQGKVGRDEADDGAGGVSEEHCTPVRKNVFLTLERKKRKAPPAPTSGSQINVIASNVSVTNDPVKSPNTSKKTLPSNSKSTNSASRKTVTTGSESVKVNHIQQSKQLNGPSVTGNQTQNSTTKPLPSDDKKNLKEDVPKSKTKDSAPSIKVGNIEHVSTTNSKTKPSSSSAASSSIETLSQISKKEEPKQPSGSITEIRKDLGVRVQGRKKSISELSSLFGGARTPSNAKSLPTSQSAQSGTSDKVKPQKTSNDTKPASTVSSPSKPSNSTSLNKTVVSTSGQSVNKEDSRKPDESKKIVSTSGQSVKKEESRKPDESKKFVSTSGQSVKKEDSRKPDESKKIVSTSGQSVNKEDSRKPDESKKIVNSSTTKSESKSLPAAAKSPSPSRHKPSSDLPASEIISLTNAGPLKNRKGQLVRPLSVIDGEEEVAISLESPRSPQNKRLLKAQGSADSGDVTLSAGTAKVSNGSPEKRKAPSAPHLGMVNGPSNETKTKDTKSTSKEAISESIKQSSTSINKVEEKKVEYPKNFRDPNYVPKKEEVSKKEDTSKKEEIAYPADFRKPVAVASTSNKSQDPVKPAPTKVSSVEDSKKKPLVKTVSKKSDQTSSDTTPSTIDKKVPVREQKKDAVKAKESPVKSTAEGHIPYPDDFRKPKPQQTTNKTKDIIRDIVKPSDLDPEPPKSAEKKDNNDNVSSGGIFGFKLRPTKKHDAGGISVIREGNDSSKPTVDNSPKAPPSGLLHVGPGGVTSAGKKKNVVKKFEKVEFIGYNSPTGKASALKTEGKSTKKGMNISFSSKEEETFEYMSEDASITYYDETHQEEEEEEEDGGKKSPQKAQAKAKVENGMKNGTLDDSHDDDDVDDGESSLKSNAPIRSSGGFQNLAASNLSATDMLLGRGPRPAEPKEPPKPAPSPEQEPEPEDMSLKPMDGSYFSSSAGTAALLF